MEAALEGNRRADVVVSLAAALKTVNSFPSLRFDGNQQHFMVPEVYVDVLKCGRRKLSHVIAP